MLLFDSNHLPTTAFFNRFNAMAAQPGSGLPALTPSQFPALAHNIAVDIVTSVAIYSDQRELDRSVARLNPEEASAVVANLIASLCIDMTDIKGLNAIDSVMIQHHQHTAFMVSQAINIPGASPSASRNSLRERGIKVRTWLIDDHYATAHKSCLDL